MLLTPQEQERFPVGIYRVNFNKVNGVPGVREAEFERSDISTILHTLIDEDMTRAGFSETITGEEDVGLNGHWPKRTYFADIEQFLDAWARGYETGISQFGTNQVYNKLGFEMFYVNWKPETDFYSFGDHAGITMMGRRADLDPVIIIGDNNGMNDQEGYLNLGVNDLRSQRVLVYRKTDANGFPDEENVDLAPSHPKQLRSDIRYYVWPGEDRFPFRSPNSLKSDGKMWTSIGISPLDIYAAVEARGFVFPEPADSAR